MKFSTAVTVFLIMMGSGLLSYKVSTDGLYPIVTVNYSAITAQAFEKNLDIVYGFSRNVANVSGTNPEKLNSPDFFQELKPKVLDDMISRELIFQELKKRIGAGEATAIAEKNISNALSGKKDASEGIEKLYGLSLAEFKESVLLPQAYQEILAGRMDLADEDFSAWLRNARKTGSILIFYPGLSWNGERVTDN